MSLLSRKPVAPSARLASHLISSDMVDFSVIAEVARDANLDAADTQLSVKLTKVGSQLSVNTTPSKVRKLLDRVAELKGSTRPIRLSSVQIGWLNELHPQRLMIRVPKQTLFFGVKGGVPMWRQEPIDPVSHLGEFLQKTLDGIRHDILVLEENGVENLDDELSKQLVPNLSLSPEIKWRYLGPGTGFDNPPLLELLQELSRALTTIRLGQGGAEERSVAWEWLDIPSLMVATPRISTTNLRARTNAALGFEKIPRR